MTFRAPNLLNLIRDAFQRHGGGWVGLRAVAMRSLNVVCALGWKGFLQRIKASKLRAAQAIPPIGAISFPEAAPLDEISFNVGVMAHVFYADLLEELARDLSHMPVGFVLMVSVADERTAQLVASRFHGHSNIRALHVRVVPNRGRDIAPFLLTFHDEILSLDVVCHVHTKKSLYTGSEQDSWRCYLLDSLLGSRRRIAWILGMFQAMPTLGLIYPESFRALPLWAHTWLGNIGCARELGLRLGVHVDPLAYIDYPAGSMFWARTSALRPLFDLGLSLHDFPEERGQTDGTLQHALERMLGLIVRQQHMTLGIMPSDGAHNLGSEGARNWHAYFNLPIADWIAQTAIDAQLVSFDLFDTLLLRPFLHPSGARAYLGFLVEKQFGLHDFAALRTRAESAARSRAGRDVDLNAIYKHLAQLPELRHQSVGPIRALELLTERRLLKPRIALVESANRLARSGKRVLAVSDMYLSPSELREVMPAPVREIMETIHVSCDNGWRKDGSAWLNLPSVEQTPAARWLHIGDNEHSDIQIPQSFGFLNPVHALRPSAMLDVVPALRGLRPETEQHDRWEDQLWLGLIANRFAETGDRYPATFMPKLVIDDAETFGYAVLGPLLLDFTTWLGRLSLERGSQKILFLSREGYLFQRAFQQVQASVPELQSIDGTYFLASRRATNTPALRAFDDLALILASPYTGSLHNLLEARLGARIATAVSLLLGEAASAEEVFLPEQLAKTLNLLRPAATAILDIAADERKTYLQYWEMKVGESNPIVADIGYAGTIQTQLSRLTGKSLGGAYFAVKSGIDQVHAFDGWASGRYFDERGNDGTPSPVMRHHLLLEAILTSPEGQFSHFEPCAEGLRPIHFPNGPDHSRWNAIGRIHAGALHFVQDACDVCLTDVLSLSFDSALIQEPLDCVGTGRWQLSEWAAGLRVEDNYTGRGEFATVGG